MSKIVVYVIGVFLLMVVGCVSSLEADSADDYFSRAERATDLIQKAALYSQAIATNTNSYWPFLYMAYFQRGMAYKQLGFMEEAIDDFGRTLVHSKGFCQAHYERAELFAQAERWDDVCEELALAESKDALSFTRFTERSYAYFQVGDFDNALKDAKKAIEFEGDVLSLWELHILSEVNLYRLEDAFKSVEKTADILAAKKGFVSFLKGLISYLLFRDKEWHIYHKAFGTSDPVSEQDEQAMKHFKEDAMLYWHQAKTEGFDVLQKGLWKDVWRLREHLGDFMTFYIQEVDGVAPVAESVA